MSKIEKRIKKIAKLKAKLMYQLEELTKIEKEYASMLNADNYHLAKKAHKLPEYVGTVVKPRKDLGLTDC